MSDDTEAAREAFETWLREQHGKPDRQANMVGKLIAMQDQRTMSAQMAMEIVARNIEIGNQQVLAQLDRPAGTS